MKAYLIYDCYNDGESFSIDKICRNRSEVKQVYKQELFKFINYGPDDLHSYQCQLVNITDEEYRLLMKAVNNELECYSAGEWESEEEEQLYKLMSRIFDECVPYGDNSNCLFATDGYSDMTEVFVEYMKREHPDVEEESDEWYDIQEEFYGNDELYNSELLKFIDNNYKIYNR